MNKNGLNINTPKNSYFAQYKYLHNDKNRIFEDSEIQHRFCNLASEQHPAEMKTSNNYKWK